MEQLIIDQIIIEKPWFIDILKKKELNDITLRNLYQFYLINDNIFKILPIITSNSNISIRVLDWFVTNYAKKNAVIYYLNGKDINGDKYFNVFLQYKCKLKSYKKKLFDPFCRKQRIAFHYDQNKCVVTTIGQLNFFSWALEYGIIKYVEEHLQEITTDMISSHKSLVKKNNSPINTITDDNNTSSSDSEKKRKKRQELSVNMNKTINIQHYSVVLTFD